MLPALRYIWCCCSVPPALISLSARRLSVLPRSFYLLLQTIFFVEIVNYFLCNCSNSAGFFNLVILRLKAPVIALPALLVPTSTISPSAYLTGLFAVDLACLNNNNHLVHNTNVCIPSLYAGATPSWKRLTTCLAEQQPGKTLIVATKRLTFFFDTVT